MAHFKVMDIGSVQSHFLVQCWPRFMTPFGPSEPFDIINNDAFMSPALMPINVRTPCHLFANNCNCSIFLFLSVNYLAITWSKLFVHLKKLRVIPWWRHQMETFSTLLAFCAGNSPITGELPAQRPVTRTSDDFFDLSLNKRFSKQSWGWWF